MTATTPDQLLARQLADEVPNLRAFARSLTINRAQADDLVQETILKAWSRSANFEPGTNLRAWLFTILRNTFLSAVAKSKREVEDANGARAARTVGLPPQGVIPELIDFKRAFVRLPGDQREALVLVGAEGFSYDEAAAVCGCAVGTVKSRVNRGRRALALMLGIENGDLAASDKVSLAVLAASERRR